MASVLFDCFLPFFGQIFEQALLSSSRDQQLARQAEELRATYTANDLCENWEFKFLRASGGDFASSRFRQHILDMEAKAGWTIVDEFDSSRIRLKRPASAKLNDHLIEFDPYRTTIPVEFGSDSRIAGLGLIAVVCLAIMTACQYNR